jgi:hypothetical protein
MRSQPNADSNPNSNADAHRHPDPDCASYCDSDRNPNTHSMWTPLRSARLSKM